jgi:alanyl-tRNA synthetase
MSSRLSDAIRQRFVHYFTSKHGHKFIRSSPVVPKNDPTLAFVNAGMNQFKPLFLADLDRYSPSRVCNYQKCIRVGGKMCDLDKIGHDFTHHTFFEMLGNWSFNDYGKPQACEWALDFLVNELGLDMSKIHVTYFSNRNEEDSETRDIWLKLGIKPEKIKANDQGDNFWEMGTSGPCGISTEIFYPVGDDLLEVWNLVFIDRQRLADDPSRIVPLRNRFVDTGMGLERILSVLCNTNSNYDTDLFKSLIRVIEAKCDLKPYGGSLTDELDINYRVLADHCRTITIALADGIEPGRREAAFSLRSIIKKSVLISRDVFHQETPRYLLFDLVDETVSILGNAYPELPASVKKIRRVLAHESKRYLNHLNKIKVIE